MDLYRILDHTTEPPGETRTRDVEATLAEQYDSIDPDVLTRAAAGDQDAQTFLSIHIAEIPTEEWTDTEWATAVWEGWKHGFTDRGVTITGGRAGDYRLTSAAGTVTVPMGTPTGQLREAVDRAVVEAGQHRALAELARATEVRRQADAAAEKAAKRHRAAIQAALRSGLSAYRVAQEASVTQRAVHKIRDGITPS